MSARDLDAAGIRDPALRASYLRCRELHRRFGRSYFLATRLLPRAKRPSVHALYGFARHADEIVDRLDSTLTVAQKRAVLTEWGDALLRDAKAGASDDPVCAGVVDTVRRWDIPLEHFVDFLTSMHMDLSIAVYPTYDDLRVYMRGSAAAIGLMMLPILEPTTPDAEAPATALGVAFQLTNFIRDVGEDLRRGRVYLPLEDLHAFGLTVEDLYAGEPADRVRRLVAFQVRRTRAIYRDAEPGIALLHPTSRPCIRSAYALYGAILDEVERARYEVLDRRVRVGRARRAALVARALRAA
ncbi:MAG TPA: phytoene/squalene synthase family protein [Mycobacteriales bacterium]|nr:phytoene/squalene synthase family protein [Mycobacteriales bacterium]